MTGFDLTEESWVRVRRADGTLDQLSLRDVFTQAPQLRALSGEIPTQDAAALRLLLAIMHRALEPARRKHGNDLDFWGQLWARRERLPLNSVQTYLDTWRHRFDLFDTERPFMQVAGLRTAKDDTFGLERLIADVPTGEQFFTTRAGAGLESVSAAEAARWLVHCQAFDVSGIKSGAVGDPRVKGGKGYPIGCGWAGQIGLVQAEGATLAETLLLNLVFRSEVPTGVPVWEREDAHGPGVDENHPEPDSVVDTLVWQSRRIRLAGDGELVRRVLLCNGDPFGPHDRFTIEAASGWRRSEPQEKKLKRSPVYMPRLHQPDRALWRGLEPLLAMDVRPTGPDSPPHLRPGVLGWLADLEHRGLLSDEQVVRVRAVGLVYGSNNSVVDSLIDDVVLLHASVLSDTELQQAATEAVRHADGAVRALAELAANITRAAGGDPEGPRDRAYDLGYHTLDRAYREWVQHLVAGCDIQGLLVAWDVRVNELLWPLREGVIREGGTPAFLGRMLDQRGKRVLIDSGWAARTHAHFHRLALPHLPEPAAPKEKPVPDTDQPSEEVAS